MKDCADQDGLQVTDLGVCYYSYFPHIVPKMPVQVDVLPDLVCYGCKCLHNADVSTCSISRSPMLDC